MRLKKDTASLPQNEKTGLRAILFENRFCALAFFCAAVIMILVFYCFDMVPFGDMTILRMDLYHQYGPLFAELYERIKNGQSLLYSWNTALGGSFLGNFFNYLSSPLFIVIFLFKHVDLPDAIALMILLKASFAAAFFTYYLRRSQQRNDHVTAAFGVLYAFCGFFIAYYWNVMWIDAMALFPLVMLGIEQIQDKRSFLLFSVTLAVVMISNYYMAIMVCIFSVLYFLTRYFAVYGGEDKYDALHSKFSVKNSRFLTSGLTFAFAAGLAACLALFALLPTFFILKNCSATSGTFPTEMKSYYAVFDFLANHLASVEPTIRSSGTDVLPNIYCGIVTILLIPLYLLDRGISIKEKVSYVLLLAVLYFSFNINYANYIWHGFHFPNDLPYRFSFMYSFILLSLAFRAIGRVKHFSGAQILTAGIGVLGFIVLTQKIGSKNVSDNTVLISIAFTFVYTLVLAGLRSKRFQAGSMALLLLCCVISESAIANTDHYSMNQSKANYSGDYEDFADLKTKLDKVNGDKMYRMELSSLRTRMDPAWYNYQGISTFSSMAPEKLSNLQSHLGMYGNYINSFTYHPQTPIYNAMMGLKYVVKKKDSKGLGNSELYTLRAQNKAYEAYENNYCLPVAFCVNDLVENWNDSESSPFAVQADFLRRASFEDGVFTPMIVTDVYCDNLENITEDDLNTGYADLNKQTAGNYGSVTVTIEAVETQNCYLYVKSRAVETIYVNSVDGDRLNETQGIDEAYILDLGMFKKGETAEVEIPMKDDSDTGSLSFYACGIDMDAFRDGFETLRKGQLNITTFTERRIEGTLTALPEQILFTSIPFDAGWHVTIDGKTVNRKDYLRIGDALLGIRLKPGSHTVTMEYFPAGLFAGASVSILTIALLVLGIVISDRRRKQAAALWTTPAVEQIEETPDTPEYLQALYEDAPEPDYGGFSFADPFTQDEGSVPDFDMPQAPDETDVADEPEFIVSESDSSDDEAMSE